MVFSADGRVSPAAPQAPMDSAHVSLSVVASGHCVPHTWWLVAGRRAAWDSLGCSQGVIRADPCPCILGFQRPPVPPGHVRSMVRASPAHVACLTGGPSFSGSQLPPASPVGTLHPLGPRGTRDYLSTARSPTQSLLPGPCATEARSLGFWGPASRSHCPQAPHYLVVGPMF